MDNTSDTTSKKSFILYYDSQHLFNMLPDTQAGRLIKAIYEYEINGTIPNYDDDIAFKMAFTTIQLCLDREKEKYNNVCERNKRNIQKRWNDNIINTTGKIGIPKNTKNTTGISGIPKNTKNTDNDSDIDNDNDNDNDSDIDNVNVNENDKENESSKNKLEKLVNNFGNTKKENNQLSIHTLSNGKTIHYENIGNLKLNCDCINCNNNALFKIDNKNYCYEHFEKQFNNSII